MPNEMTKHDVYLKLVRMQIDDICSNHVQVDCDEDTINEDHDNLTSDQRDEIAKIFVDDSKTWSLFSFLVANEILDYLYKPTDQRIETK